MKFVVRQLSSRTAGAWAGEFKEVLLNSLFDHHCPSKFDCSFVLSLFIEDQQINAEHAHKCFTLKGRARELRGEINRLFRGSRVHQLWSWWATVNNKAPQLNTLESYLSENTWKRTVYYGHLTACRRRNRDGGTMGTCLPLKSFCRRVPAWVTFFLLCFLVFISYLFSDLA